MAKRQDSNKKVLGRKHTGGGNLGDKVTQEQVARLTTGCTKPMFVGNRSRTPKSAKPKPVDAKKVERAVVIDGGILDLMALSSLFSGKRHFEINGLVVQAKPAKLISGYYTGVRVYFCSAPEGHSLHDMSCSDHFIELDHILLGEVPENFFKGDKCLRRMCVFLHEADLKADSLRKQTTVAVKQEQPNVVETPAQQTVQTVETSAEIDSTEPVGVSTNTEDFKAGKEGHYDLRRPGSKTSTQVKVFSDGKVIRFQVIGTEGRRFERTAGNAVGFSFTLDQLLGKTLLARHIVDGFTANDVAKREVIDFIRGLLKVNVQEVVLKHELPKASPAVQPANVVEIKTGEPYVAPAPKFTAFMFRKELSGACTFEGVELQGSMGYNQAKGIERFEVRVISVPDEHPDCDALRLLSHSNFLATFVVVGYDHYPRELLNGALLSKADGLEALWKLLRRAFGMPDGSTVLQTAGKTSKGVKSA